MNELVQQILSSVIIAVLPILTTFLIKWSTTQIQKAKNSMANEDVKKYLDIINTTIKLVVEKTEQTIVKAAKDNDTWTPELAKEIFEKTFNEIKIIVGKEGIEVLSSVINDINKYIEAGIEAQVRKLRG